MANRILVVDDEPQIQHLLRTALEGRGYEVRLAGDGRAALDAAASSWPNVIILDLGLPVIEGIEVCRRIREWSRVPIIVLSAREGDRDKVEALDLGADDYLTKPFSMEELLARLRVAMRHTGQQQASAQPVLEASDLQMDLQRRVVSLAGDEIHLTPTEFDLLRVLLSNA